MSQTKPPAYVALIARRLVEQHDAQVEAGLSALLESDPDCPVPYVLADPPELEDGSVAPCLACGCCPSGCGHFAWYCSVCAELPHGQSHLDGPR